MPSLANPPETSPASTQSPHASISGPAYLSALSKFITTHESALAAYYAPRLRHSASNGGTIGGGGGGPSWGTILTLGILPDSPAAAPSSGNSRRPLPSTATPRKDPLVLQFDPHHLYYILLKFDELGLSTGDELDIKVDGGHARPMSVDHTAAQGAGMIDIINEGTAPTPSLLAGMFGFGGGSGGGSKRQDDTRSVMSGKSSFSFGSGWWGLGGGGGGSATQTQSDEPTQVRHIYSSCTKLPALKLSPFVFSPSSQSQAPSISRPPSQAVEGFEDCPPPSTCVPLSLFHSLTSLYLQDLDPRAFAGWDVLSIQLKKLEVVRGGIEDVGELICDCVVEDEARSKRKRAQEASANETVGEGRRKRAEGSASSTLLDESNHSIPSNDSYPSPSKLAWSSLRHLSLHDNSLTFLPAPPLSHLPMLTSLDLSSNLLISVPPALSSLTSLRSLNLRDNMIDNLHSLPTILGAIEVLNLSQNRLENLSGLDRLLALERLDLRGNRIYEALEVSRLARLPNLREIWIKENPFARLKEEGGEEGWRIKCLAYFEEERLLRDDPAETDEEGVRVDGKGIEGRTERKAVEAEVAKRSGGAFLPGRTMRRRASTGFGSRQGDGEGSNGAGVGLGVAPKKVVVEPRRRVVTVPMSAQSSRQRQLTVEQSPPGSLSTSPVLGGPPRPISPISKPARRRKPKRIVDLDAPLSGGVQPVAPSSTQQQSDSDATTTSSGPEGGKGLNRIPTSLATVQEPVSSSSNSTAPTTPRKHPSSHQKFASSPSHTRESPARNDFTSLGPSTSPTKSRFNRRERISASTYEAPLGGGGEATSSGGEGGGGGEALRRKIEKLREEVGENWLSVLGEREARALQQKEKDTAVGKAESKEAETHVKAEAAEPRRQQSEEAVEGLAVSSGVKVVKKKGKKKKGKGK
ncbi:hypothetical protein JCM5353_001049 [Sporobolomyces roseus]